MKCPDNFTQFEERCYKYIPTLATWHEARVTCLEDYDADLISLDRPSIFDHVRANFGGKYLYQIKNMFNNTL